MRLIIEHRDPEAVRALQHGFQPHPNLEARVQKRLEPGVAPGVDAFYVPLAAAERWGAPGRPRIHQAQVFRTRPEDHAKGWPLFVIAGFTLRQDEKPLDPRLMPLVVKAAVVAARRFNAQGNEAIESIGFESGFTLIERLRPLEAAELIRAAYDEAMAVPDDELDGYGRVKPHIIAAVDFIGATGQKVSTELRCLLEFQGKRYECALILDEIGRLDIGGNEGVPIEFLSPESARPRLEVGSKFRLLERRRFWLTRIGDGVVQQVLAAS